MEIGLALLAALTLAILFAATDLRIQLKYVRKQEQDFVDVTVFWLKHFALYKMHLSNQAVGWENKGISLPDKIHNGQTNKTVRGLFEVVSIFPSLKPYSKYVANFINWLHLKPALKPLPNSEESIQAAKKVNKFPSTVYKTLRIILRFINLHNRIMLRLSRFMKCEKFCWVTKIGLEDAAETGFIAGWLWWVKSIILDKMAHRTQMKVKPWINVIPVFGTSRCDINFECIFTIRVGHVIHVGYYLMKLMPKGGKRSE